jgi:hypothetical protein
MCDETPWRTPSKRTRRWTSATAVHTEPSRDGDTRSRDSRKQDLFTRYLRCQGSAERSLATRPGQEARPQATQPMSYATP